MSKKTLLLALLICTPALGTVTITCTDEGSSIVRIDYTVSGEPAKVRAFALDVSVSGNVTITDVTDFDEGEGDVYGIFPGTIDLTDPNIPDWGTPVAPSSDPGAEGTGLGTNRVIIEMGSLYEPNLTGPPNSGRLCRLEINLYDYECNVTITTEPIRGGGVLENGDTVSIVSPGCTINFLCCDFHCWNWLGQCHGDTVLDDLIIDLGDFQVFKAAFGYDYWNDWNGGAGPYNPCADYDGDGYINLGDFQTFKAAFGVGSVLGDCTPGGTWPPVPPS